MIFLERTLPWCKDDRDIELDGILETQHNRSFVKNGMLPFWRVVILTPSENEQSFVASFIYHHALGDGASGLVFHQDFLSALSSGSSPLESNIVYLQKQDLLPNLELAHPLPLPISAAPHTPKGLWSGEKVRMPTSGHFQSLVVSEESTALLVQSCRKEGATITAAISVIVATSLMSIIPSKFQELECTVAVSLRRWLADPIDSNSMGVWMDAFSQYYRRENVSQFNWQEVRRSRELITEYLQSGGERISVAKFRGIPDMNNFFLSRVGLERGTSFDVSNLGGLPSDTNREGRGWRMRRMLFSRSAFVSGSAIACGVLTGQDGCLTLGFCWQEGIVPNDTMRELIDHVRTEIESIAKTRGLNLE